MVIQMAVGANQRQREILLDLDIAIQLTISMATLFYLVDSTETPDTMKFLHWILVSTTINCT